MTIGPIPVQRLLVPAEPPPLPPGTEVVDAALLNGLPHQIALGSSASALLIAPTGLAVAWRDADPSVRVSASDDELAPRNPNRTTGNPLSAPPARLLVRRTDGTLIGVVPLVAGLTMHLPLGEGSFGTAIDLTMLSWDLRAGNLRGPGDFGGRVSVAWRRVDQAPSRFEPPPVHPMVRLRTPPPAPVAVPPPGQASPPPTPGAVQIGRLDLMISELGIANRVFRLRASRGFGP